MNPTALLEEGARLQQQGALAEAADRYTQVLRFEPANADALYKMAQVSCQQEHFEAGIRFAQQALAVEPRWARAHLLLGMASARLGRLQEALVSFDQAVSCAPDLADAHGNRGDVLVELGRHADAIESYDRALSIQPRSPENWCNRGAALFDLGRYQEALVSFRRAVAIAPQFAQACFNCGNTLLALARHADAAALSEEGSALRPDALECRREALASYEEALRHNPKHPEALNNRGVVLMDLGLREQAISSYEQALAIAPNHAGALCNRAKALLTLNRLSEALSSADRALVVNADDTHALFTRGNVLVRLGRYDGAIACYEQVLKIAPRHRHASASLVHCYMTICDWKNVARIERALIDRIATDVATNASIVPPLTLLGLGVNPATLLKCTRRFTEHEIARATPMPPRRVSPRSDKIKLAYLSADFGNHPVSVLAVELFELHDRNRFDVLGVSIGADDGSEIRTRVARSFDRFLDVAAETDNEVAKLLHELDVDVLVDLGGYTEGARPNILAFRPAPVQATYIGFLATMGADFIDYLIADEVVLPRGHDIFYSERIVRLPECVQVNDSKRRLSSRIPSRSEAGLPENAFVFCCFNGNYKITAATFDVWMRLLHTVDNSVLWLLRSNEAAMISLRHEALARGIDPTRLIFAPKVDSEDHLARHGLADLFLDTLPINAGATASDALWAGLPIVTLMGDTCPGRVSGSLLHAVGLPELVTRNRGEYEALALRLAGDPPLLASIRAKLARNRVTEPLFDTDRFRRHIEAAYTTMWEIWQRGERPRGFTVDRI